MIIITVIIFFFFSFIFSFYPLFKHQKWAELSLTIFLFLIGATYALQFYLDLDIIPHPGDLIVLFQPWADSLAKFFELNLNS